MFFITNFNLKNLACLVFAACNNVREGCRLAIFISHRIGTHAPDLRKFLQWAEPKVLFARPGRVGLKLLQEIICLRFWVHLKEVHVTMSVTQDQVKLGTLFVEIYNWCCFDVCDSFLGVVNLFISPRGGRLLIIIPGSNMHNTTHAPNYGYLWIKIMKMNIADRNAYEQCLNTGATCTFFIVTGSNCTEHLYVAQKVTNHYGFEVSAESCATTCDFERAIGWLRCILEVGFWIWWRIQSLELR